MAKLDNLGKRRLVGGFGGAGLGLLLISVFMFFSPRYPLKLS